MPLSELTEDYERYFYRGKSSTRHVNALKLKYFCKWLEASPEHLIEEYLNAKETDDLKSWERDQINRIVNYYNWLLEQTSKKTKKPLTINYARSQGIGILAFFRQNTQQLEDVTKEFAPPQLPENEFRFQQSDLRKMFYYGDTTEKALLSLAVSYGQGSNEFLNLECEQLRRIIEEARDKGLDFIMWMGKTRGKTSIQPRSFLTPEAIESVSEYLKLVEKKHGELPKYLWCNSKPDKHLTNEGLNKKFRRLVTKANIKTYNRRVHFHLIRKFTFSRLRRIDRDIAKVICAKKVSASDMTYEELDEQCEKVFRLAYKNISLNGDVSGKTKRIQTERITQLEDAVEQLHKENVSVKTVAEVMTKKMAELEHELKESKERLKKATNEIWELNSMVQPMLSVYKQRKPVLDEIWRHQKQGKSNEKGECKATHKTSNSLFFFKVCLNTHFCMHACMPEEKYCACAEKYS